MSEAREAAKQHWMLQQEKNVGQVCRIMAVPPTTIGPPDYENELQIQSHLLDFKVQETQEVFQDIGIKRIQSLEKLRARTKYNNDHDLATKTYVDSFKVKETLTWEGQQTKLDALLAQDPTDWEAYERELTIQLPLTPTKRHSRLNNWTPLTCYVCGLVIIFASIVFLGPNAEVILFGGALFGVASMLDAWD